jgi:nicotinic acid mononucleotide adenylyltransferase
MSNIVKNLINDGYKATIIECGHGALLINEFLSTPGASQLVLYGKQPYCKDVQRDEYPSVEGLRSVSQDFVYNVMRAELSRNLKYIDKIITFVSSFQLGEEGKLCHGYFGIGQFYENEPHYTIYHLSIYLTDTRKEYFISLIKDYLMKIIDRHFYKPSINVSVVDAIWESYRSPHPRDIIQLRQNIEATLMINNNIKDHENFLCFSPDNQMIRFEDIVRLNKGKNKGIIMQKGSYNPFHRMHRNIAENAKKHYPDYPHVLVLSSLTCDKGMVDTAALEERVNNLTAQGYYVMITKSGYFIQNIEWIRQYYTALNIIFPVGEDTIERFLRDWEGYYQDYPSDLDYIIYSEYQKGFENVEWFITKRNSDTKHFGALIPTYAANALNNFKYSDLDMDDISSTKIRTGEIKNEL